MIHTSTLTMLKQRNDRNSANNKCFLSPVCVVHAPVRVVWKKRLDMNFIVCKFELNKRQTLGRKKSLKLCNAMNYDKPDIDHLC